MPTAVITGGSRGFGRALAVELGRSGWDVVITGRTATTLREAAHQIGDRATPVRGNIVDPHHRREIAAAAGSQLDLLVNNAGTLGPTPLPAVAELAPEVLLDMLQVNVAAPLGLVQALLPALSRGNGAIVNLSSDAAVEAYEGWGGYGTTKAALDQLTSVLGAEHPSLRVYSFDPGDMRTDMQRAAFPDEDISDRPLPETVVPALLTLLEMSPPSGRYLAADYSVAAR